MKGHNLTGRELETFQRQETSRRWRDFWPRQFSNTITKAQVRWDVVLGIILPVLCFIFDPIVFKGNIHDGGTPFIPISLTQFKLFVYFFSALAILTFALWLWLGSKVGLLSGILAGIMLAGAAGSFLIGVLILPLSLIGLMFLIGALGFIPFFTAFVYLRNGIRALNAAKLKFVQPKLAGAVVLGVALVVGVPALSHWQVNKMVAQSMADILRSDGGSTEAAVRRLQYVGWAADLDQIVWAYAQEQEPSRKQNLAGAYREITGSEIENRLAIMRD